MNQTIKQPVIIALLIFALLLPTVAGAVNFKRLIVFGASLSDPGNAYALSGEAISAPYSEVDDLYVPPAPYKKGGNHFSNGATWIEQLAKQLRLGQSAEAAFGDSTDNATNYAVGGARAREDGINLSAQVATFLNDVSNTAPADALYVLDMGANDVRDALAAKASQMSGIFSDALTAIGTHLGQLYFAGARKFLVLNVPDLGALPSTRILNYVYPGIVYFAGQLTTAFNNSLDGVTAGISALPGVEMVRFDVYGKVNQVMATPSAFSLTDVASPCITPEIPPYSCKKPDSYLFGAAFTPRRPDIGFLPAKPHGSSRNSQIP